MTRPPIPSFTSAATGTMVRLAEDAWNSRDAKRVALAYTPDCAWRNRSKLFQGRTQIVEILTCKGVRELDYCLTKELRACRDNRTAVRFADVSRDAGGAWFRANGNET